MRFLFVVVSALVAASSLSSVCAAESESKAAAAAVPVSAAHRLAQLKEQITGEHPLSHAQVEVSGPAPTHRDEQGRHWFHNYELSESTEEELAAIRAEVDAHGDAGRGEKLFTHYVTKYARAMPADMAKHHATTMIRADLRQQQQHQQQQQQHEQYEQHEQQHSALIDESMVELEGPRAKEGDVNKGKELFMVYAASCHTMTSMSTGPPLKGVYGRNIAAHGDFAYSGALLGKAKLKWDDKNLDKWLQKPAGFAPGNKMGFAGVDSKQDRLDIIAYLKANPANK